jgi:hypothetical protein
MVELIFEAFEALGHRACAEIRKAADNDPRRLAAGV